MLALALASGSFVNRSGPYTFAEKMCQMCDYLRQGRSFLALCHVCAPNTPHLYKVDQVRELRLQLLNEKAELI